MRTPYTQAALQVAPPAGMGRRHAASRPCPNPRAAGAGAGQERLLAQQADLRGRSEERAGEGGAVGEGIPTWPRSCSASSA